MSDEPGCAIVAGIFTASFILGAMFGFALALVPRSDWGSAPEEPPRRVNLDNYYESK